MSLEENIRELLAKEKSGDVASVATDILRSLVILGGSAWQSDLLDTLAGLCTVKGIIASGLMGQLGLISKALKRLNDLDLIHSETRLRSDLGRKEPAKEEFHFTDHLQALARVFAADSIIDKYRREIMGYNTLRF